MSQYPDESRVSFDKAAGGQPGQYHHGGQPYPPQPGQSYGQPPWPGQQPYVPVYPVQPGYGPPPVRGTNTMAILALVFAFVFPPVGIVFGIIGRKQIRTTHEDGDGLALAGIIVGAAFTVLVVVYIVYMIFILAYLTTLVSSIPTR